MFMPIASNATIGGVFSSRTTLMNLRGGASRLRQRRTRRRRRPGTGVTSRSLPPRATESFCSLDDMVARLS
jgi:hypothetical protein